MRGPGGHRRRGRAEQPRGRVVSRLGEEDVEDRRLGEGLARLGEIVVGNPLAQLAAQLETAGRRPHQPERDQLGLVGVVVLLRDGLVDEVGGGGEASRAGAGVQHHRLGQLEAFAGGQLRQRRHSPAEGLGDVDQRLPQGVGNPRPRRVELARLQPRPHGTGERLAGAARLPHGRANLHVQQAVRQAQPDEVAGGGVAEPAGRADEPLGLRATGQFAELDRRPPAGCQRHAVLDEVGVGLEIGAELEVAARDLRRGEPPGQRGTGEQSDLVDEAFVGQLDDPPEPVHDVVALVVPGGVVGVPAQLGAELLVGERAPLVDHPQQLAGHVGDFRRCHGLGVADPGPAWQVPGPAWQVFGRAAEATRLAGTSRPAGAASWTRSSCVSSTTFSKWTRQEPDRDNHDNRLSGAVAFAGPSCPCCVERHSDPGGCAVRPRSFQARRLPPGRRSGRGGRRRG